MVSLVLVVVKRFVPGARDAQLRDIGGGGGHDEVVQQGLEKKKKAGREEVVRDEGMSKRKILK